MSTSSTTEISALVTDSPYYLHPSDNPGALITPVLLRGDNYSHWDTEIWNSLQAKRNIGFLDGTISKPTTNPDLARWISSNSMIVGWIRTAIDPVVRSTIGHVSDASKLWESLKRRFSVKNSVRKHFLEDEITNCKQNGQSVLEYYGSLSKLWEEQRTFKSSVTCPCEASTELEREHEEARVHKFLFGLDEHRFSTIRSQIIDEDPLPDLNIVYSRVIRAEQNLTNMRTNEIKQDALGFVAKTDSPIISAAAINSKQRGPNRSCSHCKRKGHDISECFSLHGYPDWYLEQQQQCSSSQPARGRGGRSSTSSGRGRGRVNSVSITDNNTSTPTVPSDQSRL